MREDGDDTLDLAVGTLDNPSTIVFKEQIGTESRLPWFQTLHLLPAVKTEKTRPTSELAKIVSLQHPDLD